jgi:ubiquinone/menaquinone biosynthesis C-methylase UbiE
VGSLVAVAVLLFARQRRLPIPLPPSLAFVLENPVTEAFVGAQRLLERAELAPGMRVLDAGCGPGRIAIPAARRVLPGGEVVALDSQEAMLRRLQERLEREDIENVRAVRGKLGTGELTESESFDRVLLVMVLGEIRGRERALGELYRATKAGGVLSVSEALGDPDYRGRGTVRREIEAAGFRLRRVYDGRVSYTMNFAKPLA